MLSLSYLIMYIPKLYCFPPRMRRPSKRSPFLWSNTFLSATDDGNWKSVSSSSPTCKVQSKNDVNCNIHQMKKCRNKVLYSPGNWYIHGGWHALNAKELTLSTAAKNGLSSEICLPIGSTLDSQEKYYSFSHWLPSFLTICQFTMWMPSLISTQVSFQYF